MSIVTDFVNTNQIERRRHPRRRPEARVEVSGLDDEGRGFECDAMLHDICEDGISMRISHRVSAGSDLVVLLHLTDGSDGVQPPPFATAHGVVLRACPRPLDTCDVAVSFRESLLCQLP